MANMTVEEVSQWIQSLAGGATGGPTVADMSRGNVDLNQSAVSSIPAATSPALSPVRNTIGATGPSSGSMLGDLVGLVANTPPAVTTTNNQTINESTQQNRSPELEARTDDFFNQLNTIGQQTTDAFNAKQATFDDIIRSVNNAFRSQGGASANALQSSALASGLTPLEASAAGSEQLMSALQQMFPQIAQLRGQQADVGIDLQSQLANLQQGLALPFIQSVISPYLQNVAGQTSTQDVTGTQTVNDPLRQVSMLSDLMTTIQNDELERLRLAQQNEQFLAQLGLDSSQFNRDLDLRGRGLDIEEDLGQQRIQSDLAQFLTGTNQRESQFSREQDRLTTQADLERQFRDYLQLSQQNFSSAEAQKARDDLYTRLGFGPDAISNIDSVGGETSVWFK